MPVNPFALSPKRWTFRRSEKSARHYSKTTTGPVFDVNELMIHRWSDYREKPVIMSLQLGQTYFDELGSTWTRTA